ncbi:MAG: IclR family transcriptional regulator [Microbacterium sp.]
MGDQTPAPRRRGGRPAVGEPLLDRAFRLLGAFTEDDPTLSLGELSAKTEVPLSSTLRIGQHLVRLGALERLPDGRFTIGLRMLNFAALAPRGHGLRAIALPYMEDLHRATRQHVQFAVREKDEGVIVERLSAPGAGRVLYHAGGRFPLHGTSLGIVMLAYARPEFRAAYLTRPLVLEPENLPVDTAALRAQLDETRSRGVATFSRVLPEPAEAIAAPVFDRDGECIAALSVLAGDGTVDLRSAEPAVIAIARAISRDVARTRLPAD